MELQRSNVIPFRRNDTHGQARLPLERATRRQAQPLDERRIAHRRRMLEFLLTSRVYSR